MHVEVSRPLRDLTQRELGALGEAVAADYLSARGYRILERNWRVRYGEIDLIAASPRGMVVFVEVKTRRSTRAGSPIEAVSARKCQRLRQLAGLWLDAHDVVHRGIRLDVIALAEDGACGLALTHLRGIG